VVRPLCHHAFHKLLIGEAAAVDHVAPKNCGKGLHTVLDETGLFWKHMPSFISIKEKTAPGFKAATDCFMLLLGENFSGDYR
jgi:hypothetical protein